MGVSLYRVQLNKERFKNHIQYDWWKYIAGICITLFMWSMISTITEPRTPDDKLIEIFLVGDYMLDESSESISNDILEDFPNLLEVNVSNIPLGVDTEMDYVGRQKLMVMLGSQTGDIYIFDKDEFKQIAEQGAFLPLDDFIEENKDLINSEDLVKHKEKGIEDETGKEVEMEPHYYGIPMEDVKLFKDSGFDVSDKLVGIMAYSKNKPAAFDVLKWILNDGVIK